MNIMRTLSFYQFLDMIEKTHCTDFTFVKRNGVYVAYLGVAVCDNSLLALFKTRPFSLQSRVDMIFQKSFENGLTLHPIPSNIFSH